MPRVAVMTLTRDRRGYTAHCFKQLRENAGIPFDHYIVDNGSEDGTRGWLQRKDIGNDFKLIIENNRNVGVGCGINQILDRLDGEYDVVIKFDNDCELLAPDTLKAAAEVVMAGGWLVSPYINGLQWTPPILENTESAGHWLGETHLIGGIFLAAPGRIFQQEGYRHQTEPIWGMDDVNLCAHWKQQGGKVGYLLGYPAWHYESTEGQMKRYPKYFKRKLAEYEGVWK